MTTAQVTDKRQPKEAASSRNGRRLGQPAVGFFSIFSVLIVWEALARGPLNGLPVPAATSTANALVQMLGTDQFWYGVRDTAVTALLGLGAAAGLGIPLGMLLGRVELVYRMMRPVMEFFKPIPPIVILPLAIMVLGPTVEMGVFLVFFGCLFMIGIQTMAGVHDIDPAVMTMAKSYRLRRMFTMMHVVLPAALPFIVTGLRIATASALIIAVGAEMVGGAPGIGKDMFLASAAGNMPILYAYVLFLGLLGVGLNSALSAAERSVLKWHTSVRGVTS